MSKKIYIFVLTAAALLTAVLPGCSKTAKPQAAETRVITDHTGGEIEIPVQINRIVIGSLLPLPSVYCLFAGSAEKIVGMNPGSMSAAENSFLPMLFPDILNADTGFVENNTVNIEQLLNLEPDVVFYSATNQQEREAYQAAGIPAVGFSTSIAGFNCIETYAAWISLLGDIFGEEEKAREMIEYGRQTEARISAKIASVPESEKPRVLILFHYDNGIIKTSGSNFFGQYWIETAGGINVARDLNGMPQINMEQVYAWDPDMIFITNFSPYLPEDLYGNAIAGHDWSTVKAVRNGRVYKFPLGMYRWYPPSSDTPLSLQWLACKMQPQLFADTDMDEVIKSYYARFYNVQLTDGDLRTIYNPARAASGK
ncbi:ABC transporter substrate-binding protein [Treponema brennaborense]|uniref:ABC-type transporter, periplasmic subunit n=1 Tax=Treponema brennaborense (strain DSM 12168 / CIP 105900 / DD5/3) TaxID=906968 RepID=F4LLI9_TREBD|nr:ABC transporter substrate-binding protein [Treponema brennaborense]AEE16653.1 ABC-type transporter, periplasmic subunit [Treponema brennaborense DSM 12168]